MRCAPVAALPCRRLCWGATSRINICAELLELGHQELVAALNTLTSSGILLQTGSIPNASFEFRHALLRDIAYQTLLR